MIEFCKICEQVYERMKSKSFQTTKGDEFILSLAAHELQNKIKNASPYIYRFWTGANFRLVSTCYQFNRIIILHVPAEKEKGMKKLYERFIQRGDIPNDGAVWKMLRLKKLPLVYKIIPKIKYILRKY